MRIINGRVAGALYLVIIVVGIASELIRSQMLVAGDVAATAENVQESGWLLRAAVSATLAHILCEVVLTVILYQLFTPVSRPISMVAAAFRLASLAIYGLNLLNLIAPVLLLDSGQPQTFALLFLNLHQYGYLNRPGFRAHLPSWEGWHDVDQVRPGAEGEGGPPVPRSCGGLSVAVGGDEGDLGPAGDDR